MLSGGVPHIKTNHNHQLVRREAYRYQSVKVRPDEFVIHIGSEGNSLHGDVSGWSFPEQSASRNESERISFVRLRKQSASLSTEGEVWNCAGRNDEMHRTETVGVGTGGVLTKGSGMNTGGLRQQRWNRNVCL